MMWLKKLVLGATATVFSGYGIACLMDPGYPAGLIGLQYAGADARIELAAMYGGLQTALGLFCFTALLRPAHMQTAVLLVFFAAFGLAAGRAGNLLLSDTAGLLAPTAYTYAAIAYEAITAILAGACLLVNPQNRAKNT